MNTIELAAVCGKAISAEDAYRQAKKYYAGKRRGKKPDILSACITAGEKRCIELRIIYLKRKGVVCSEKGLHYLVSKSSMKKSRPISIGRKI